MGVVRFQVFGLLLKIFAFAWAFGLQGSAVSLIGEGNLGKVSNTNVFINIAPSPVPQPNATGVQPPQVISPVKSAPVPLTKKGHPPSVLPNPSASAPNPFILSPARNEGTIPSAEPPQHRKDSPFMPEAPAPVTSPAINSPPNEQTHPTVPESTPPNPRQTKAPAHIAPVSAIAPGIPASPPPPDSIFPAEPPSLPPDVPMHPALPRNSSPVKPIPIEPPSNPPVHNAPRMLVPPPSINKKTAAMPVVAPTKGTAHHYTPVSHSSTEAPTASKPNGHPNSTPPPRLFSKSAPMFLSPTKHHHAKVYKSPPAPVSHVIPPTSGFSSAPPTPHPSPSSSDRYSPSPASPSSRSKVPSISPKPPPSRLSPRSPKIHRPPPVQTLPPPPPHTDCASLTCQDPLTYGPPESPCVCVLPIQVGLRLDVALYTFFPLVSELATEIAAGVSMKQSQVRIMGANAAQDDPDKTFAHIDLLPLGRNFDDTTAYLTFQRFWNKQVAINTSFFGDYDVLYVRYPGLPPSPPLPPSATGIMPSKPYPGHNNKTRTIQPLGVDISREQHKHGLNAGMLAAIIVSCLVTVILFCVVSWLLIFRHRHCAFQLDPTPPTTMHSVAKSSGIPMSMVENGPSSPSFSLGSSIAACAGSARTFSSSEIERATSFFNEMRIIGEGGFGRVYGGVLEDGTKVAIKILKRYDQQGGREFLAEVEMLSRLHHRNLVKLIGICIEDRARCLVYELIPNGSVESHLHGIDKERSPLDWSARLKIALGAARALAYLHEDSSPRVIHRDFKASNILLEDDFTPKVSDFGLARAALDEENRHISTRVMGTFGYLAPEYAMTGHLLIKSDVYSYGVVLLELLTGRKPVDMSQPPGQENLVTWARPLLASREGLESVVDPSLGPDFPFDSVAKVAAIASMCVQPEVSHRPFMGEVVQALRLVCNECEETQDAPSESSSHEDFSLILDERDAAHSNRLVEALLTPSDGYDYELSDVSLSELLSTAANAGVPDASFRRYCSSSGSMTTSRARQIWKTMRRLSRGTVSEHGAAVRLWPGSH